MKTLAKIALIAMLLSCGGDKKEVAKPSPLHIPKDLNAMLHPQTDLVFQVDFTRLRASKLFSDDGKVKNKINAKLSTSSKTNEMLLQKAELLLTGVRYGENGQSRKEAIVRGADLNTQDLSELKQEIGSDAQLKELSKGLWVIATPEDLAALQTRLFKNAQSERWWAALGKEYSFSSSAFCLALRRTTDTARLLDESLRAQNSEALRSQLLAGLVHDFEYVALSLKLETNTSAQLGLHAADQAKLDAASNYLDTVLARYRKNLLLRALGLDKIVSAVTVSSGAGRLTLRASLDEALLMGVISRLESLNVGGAG